MECADDYTIDKLVTAVQHGDLNFLEKGIEQFGMSANAKDSIGFSLLHWAAINNRIKIVKYLLSRCAIVNCGGGDTNETPLHWAVRNEKLTQMVHLLIGEGQANLFHKSSSGHDPLHLACQCGNVNIAFLLLHFGGDPNSVDNKGDTALYWLLKNKCSESLDLQRLLMSFNANVTLGDRSLDNALHILVAAAPKAVDYYAALHVYKKGFKKGITTARNSSGLRPYDVALKIRNTTMANFLIDAYMYHTLPNCVPVVISALVMCSFFFFLHYLGWAYGSGCFALMLLLWDKTAQQWIFSDASRQSYGFAWGIIISIIASFFVFVMDSVCAYWTVVIVVTAVVIACTLLGSNLVKPASLVVDGDRVRLVEKIVASGLPEGLKFVASSSSGSGNAAEDSEDDEVVTVASPVRLCTTCLVDKCAASIHCARCNMCVPALDHHCDWVSNCVGRGNRRMFVWFTCSASLGCALYAVLALWVQHHILCPDARGAVGNILAVQICSVVRNPAFATVTWLSIFATIWIGFLFAGQIGLIAAETTTFEVMRGRHHGRCNWSLQGVCNVFNFCRTGLYSVMPPVDRRDGPKSSVSASVMSAASGMTNYHSLGTSSSSSHHHTRKCEHCDNH